MTPPERLQEERQRLGQSQRAFAQLVGVSKNTQLAYETGSSPITLDYLEKAAVHGINLGYVALGIREAAAPTHIVSRRQPQKDDEVEVAQIDLRFGLGGTFMDESVVPAMRTFSRAWLRQISDSPPEQLYWAPCQGNSMEPNIGHGDIVLIDRQQVTPGFGDLYWAIAFGQLGMVKRLRPMPDGTVKILSDNPSVHPELAADGEVHIFGRVVAVVKRV